MSQLFNNGCSTCLINGVIWLIVSAIIFGIINIWLSVKLLEIKLL